ncbi:hypothetical protein ACFO0N_09070 [Halobium salinum]|uniref:DUF7999 domain-containing protein n=1 Tax=Halobium salinum TaxID=1364940 RepID=A0ABD5PB22_9EURY|nr:hypothetical protein [Halobium salinum]
MSHAVNGDGDPGVPPAPSGAAARSTASDTSAPDAAETADAATVTVWRSTAGHDSVTVFLERKHACRQLVDYATEELRRLLVGLPTGTTLTVRMEPVVGRGDGWRVTGVP